MRAKILVTVLALVALAVGGFFTVTGQHQNSSYKTPPPAPVPSIEGTYISFARTVSNLFQIKTGPDGNPIVLPNGYNRSQPWRVERQGAGYAFYQDRIQYNHWDNEKIYPDPKTGKLIWSLEFTVVPSASTPGDWDLETIQDFDGKKDLTYMRKQHRPSFLHRLDDPRVVRYLDESYYRGLVEREQAMGEPTCGCGCGGHIRDTTQSQPMALLNLAAAIAADHPNDLFARTLYLQALVRAGEFTRLAAELEQWRTRLDRPSPLRYNYRRVQQSLDAYQLNRAGRNAFDLVTSISSRRVNFAARYQLYPDILKFDTYVGDDSAPQFLAMQTQTKVMEVMANFLLLYGRRTEAMRTAAATYHWGQLLNNARQTLLTRLIGVALRNIGCRMLERHVLNACEIPLELNQAWQWLERLNADERPLSRISELEWLDDYAAELTEAQWEELFREQAQEEVFTRHNVASARFQLVRMAAATRGKQLMLGMLPKDASDLGPLFTTGAPLDPFTSAPLHLRPSPTGVTCYSFGPDRADDLGAITYDPSNGTTSRGDIVLEVPAQRQYPFPRNGVRARTPQELLAQFPNGLPPDPFADTRGRPLSISNTNPMYIYSFGPDTDENDSSVIHPEVAYDPTNGTSSSGDLFMQVPWR